MVIYKPSAQILADQQDQKQTLAMEVPKGNNMCSRVTNFCFNAGIAVEEPTTASRVLA